MMNIEGHWETVDSLEDVARIVREYYNDELAHQLDMLIEMKEDEIKELREDLHWWYDNYGL